MLPKRYKAKAQKTLHWRKRASQVQDHFGIIRKLHPTARLVLDVGCATGEETVEIKTLGYQVLGVDNEKRYIVSAKKNYPKLDFVVDTVEHLSQATDSFDVAYCLNTLFYNNLDRSLGELIRITKPKGIIFVSFDVRITDLDKGKVIHRDTLRHFRQIIKDQATIEFIVSKSRTDHEPFTHRHNFYLIAVRKT